jgi:hypothetical protein
VVAILGVGSCRLSAVSYQLSEQKMEEEGSTPFATSLAVSRVSYILLIADH